MAIPSYQKNKIKHKDMCNAFWKIFKPKWLNVLFIRNSIINRHKPLGNQKTQLWTKSHYLKDKQRFQNTWTCHYQEEYTSQMWILK